jgi:hypothetical protein
VAVGAAVGVAVGAAVGVAVAAAGGGLRRRWVAAGAPPPDDEGTMHAHTRLPPTQFDSRQLMLPHCELDAVLVLNLMYHPFCLKQPGGYEVMCSDPADPSAEGHRALRAAVQPFLSVMGRYP